ncbi:MAG: Imm26 family immunity protein [Alphaproteobacteria bacterium]
MLKRKTVKIGDIFQILTSKGVCYGQIINKSKKWGYVVAIFREFFDKTPKDFTEIVSKEPQLITCFVINYAVREGLFALVDNVPVSNHLKEFPIFKGTNFFKGNDTMWFFWDGDKEWRVHRPLTEEEKKYPEGPSLPSAPLLIERIETNYRVERDYI